MKYNQLSQFQKQQYTNYLETHLQKFSLFMVTQKKENERYRILEDAIAYQTNVINQIHSKLQLLQIYQHQHHQQLEHATKRVSRVEDVEDRVSRLENRQKYGCDDTMQKGKGRHLDEGQGQLALSIKECMKKIKKQQQEIDYWSNTISQLRKKDSLKLQTQDSALNRNTVCMKDLKKLQARIMQYFQESHQQKNTSKQRKRKKSPSPQISQLSIIDNYQIKQANRSVNSFRIDESLKANESLRQNDHSFSNKSEMSTLLHDSHSTNKQQQNSRQRKPQRSNKIKLKSKSKSKSKSRSKSKSKSKDKSRSKSKSRSRSKKQKKMQNKDKSLSFSDDSVITQSLSKSKSKKSKSRQRQRSSMVKSKDSKRYRKSKRPQKTHPNSHQQCKKRPQIFLKVYKNVQKKKGGNGLKRR